MRHKIHATLAFPLLNTCPVFFFIFPCSLPLIDSPSLQWGAVEISSQKVCSCGSEARFSCQVPGLQDSEHGGQLRREVPHPAGGISSHTSTVQQVISIVCFLCPVKAMVTHFCFVKLPAYWLRDATEGKDSQFFSCPHTWAVSFHFCLSFAQSEAREEFTSRVYSENLDLGLVKI